MLNEVNITILITIASSAFALLLLEAISTEQGLISFAFALAAALAMILGNLDVLQESLRGLNHGCYSCAVVSRRAISLVNGYEHKL